MKTKNILKKKSYNKKPYKNLSPRKKTKKKEKRKKQKRSGVGMRNTNYKNLCPGRLAKFQEGEIKPVKLLGNGNFGVVSKVSIRGREYAEKELKITNTKSFQEKYEEMKHELDMLCRLDNKAKQEEDKKKNFVITFHFYTYQKESKLIKLYLSLHEGGDLINELQRLKQDPVDYVQYNMPRYMRYLMNIKEALEFTHRAGIIHNDIAARNILLSADKKSAILTDYGISKAMDENREYNGNLGKVSVFWFNPNNIIFKKLNVFSDFYSYGCLVFEMFSLGVQPFTGIKFDIKNFKPIHRDLENLLGSRNNSFSSHLINFKKKSYIEELIRFIIDRTWYQERRSFKISREKQEQFLSELNNMLIRNL